MAGGVGSRFWPASRSSFPKQFLDLTGEGRSMLQQTYDRLEGIVPKDQIYILTNARYKSIVATQLPELTETQIICEPEMRNTAPCLLYAGLKIQQRNPKAAMVVLPSDHYIADLAAFKNDMRTALSYAGANTELLTFGIPPRAPHTGYGYLEVADKGEVFSSIKTFTEKPTLEKAESFIADGNYFWNSGIFVWSSQTLLAAFRLFQPKMLSLFEAGISTFGTPEEAAFLAKEYKKAENISIDYAILEKSKNISMIKANFHWNDLGTWTSLYDQLMQEEKENVAVNAHLIVDTAQGNMVYTAKEKRIVLKGLENFVVVDEEDVLLIYPKGEDQSVKDLRNSVKAQGGDSIV